MRLNGVMIETARGAKVRAPCFGRVVYADWLQGMGLLLIIAHSGNYMTLYGHAEVLYKSVGDWVAPGDVIARGERCRRRAPAAVFRDTRGAQGRRSEGLAEGQPVKRRRSARSGALQLAAKRGRTYAARLMSTKCAQCCRSLAAGIVIGLSLSDLRAAVLADKPAALGQDVPWQDARLLAEVLERVEREYVDPVDDHQLLQAAIRGMVSSLDPYSAYLDGDEYDEIKISSSGQYSGVGIEVSMEDGQVVVVAPFDGSPAAAAGIRSGDVIATIDGVPVNTTTLADTIGRMRGKEGTSVKIGILREGSTEPLQFTSSARASNCTA